MRRHFLARLTCLVIVVSFIFSSFNIRADDTNANSSDPKTQVVGDLLAAGVSVAAAFSGFVPLALLSGYITKYITTYGIAGVHALVSFIKGHDPQDLGEINIYHIYLIHIKRNLYQALIQVRQSVDSISGNQALLKEIKKFEDSLNAKCDVNSGCIPTPIDDQLVNTKFINLALDANATLDINRYLEVRDFKNTYQYLMLLYLDLMIVEQKLLDAENNALAMRTNMTLDELNSNEYLSNEEKEYQAQLLIGIGLRFQLMENERRILVAKMIEKPTQALHDENEKINEKFEEYKKR